MAKYSNDVDIKLFHRDEIMKPLANSRGPCVDILNKVLNDAFSIQGKSYNKKNKIITVEL